MVVVPVPVYSHSRETVAPSIGQCRWEEQECVNPATKYDYLCNAHRRVLHERKRIKTRTAPVTDILRVCSEMLKKAPPQTPYEEIASEAATKLYTKSYTFQFINWFMIANHARMGKQLVKAIFCLALLRHQHPGQNHTMEEAWRIGKANKIRIKRSYEDNTKYYLEAAANAEIHEVEP